MELFAGKARAPRRSAHHRGRRESVAETHAPGDHLILESLHESYGVVGLVASVMIRTMFGLSACVIALLGNSNGSVASARPTVAVLVFLRNAALAVRRLVACGVSSRSSPTGLGRRTLGPRGRTTRTQTLGTLYATRKGRRIGRTANLAYEAPEKDRTPRSTLQNTPSRYFGEQAGSREFRVRVEGLRHRSEREPRPSVWRHEPSPASTLSLSAEPKDRPWLPLAPRVP